MIAKAWNLEVVAIAKLEDGFPLLGFESTAIYNYCDLGSVPKK